MNNGDVTLLENVRFQADEEKNDDGLAQALAKLGDIYVNDAFGAAHRAHASTAGIAKYVPQAAMGLLMEKELAVSRRANSTIPPRPFVVILGGSKVSDKIGVIKALMEKADTFLIGGAMAYTFFKAQGIPTGKSRVEADKVDLATELLELAKRRNIQLPPPGGQPGDDRVQRRTQHRVRPRFTPLRPASLMITKRSISDPRRSSSYRRRSPRRRPSSGTDRWASSRWRLSRKARVRSRKPLRKSPAR